MEVSGVMHVEADHEDELVRVWTESDEPDTDALRKAFEDAGFKVTRVRVEPSKKAEADQ